MSYQDTSGMNRLYLANLGEGMDQDWIMKTFGQFSPVQKVFVMHDRKSKSGRYSAFVTLTDQASCQRAIDALHGSPCIDGNQYGLVVRFSEPPGAKPPVQNMGYQQPHYNNNSWGGNNSYNNNYGGGMQHHGGGGGYHNNHNQHHQQHHGGGGNWNQNRGGGGYHQQQQHHGGQGQAAQQGSSQAPSATGNVIYSGGKAWYEASDPATRKTYYYTSAGETTWDRPVEDGGKKKGGYQNPRGRPY